MNPKYGTLHLEEVSLPVSLPVEILTMGFETSRVRLLEPAVLPRPNRKPYQCDIFYQAGAIVQVPTWAVS